MNWSEYFYYDETSPSCLRWKVKRKGVEKDSVAGGCAGRDYYSVSIKNRKHSIHRIIWELFNGELPNELVIDHIDQNKKNNKIANLRSATRQGNGVNSKLRLNKSGFRGVYKYRSRWCACISPNGNKVHIGVYDTAEEAAREYDRKAKELFGDLTTLNFRQ